MACTGPKKPKQRLTLHTKLEILQMYDTAKHSIKINELAKSMKLSRRTLMTILKNRVSIETAPQEDRHRFRVRNKARNPQAGKSKYQKLDEALAMWVSNNKSKGKACSGAALRQKALKLAKKMDLQGFTASNGWSDRFKKKYNFKQNGHTCDCGGNAAYKADTKVVADVTTQYLGNLLAACKNRTSQEDVISSYKDIEKELMKWLHKIRDNKARVTGSLTREMALNVAGLLGVSKFTASSGWLDNFQKKCKKSGIWQCSQCTETGSNQTDWTVEETSADEADRVAEDDLIDTLPHEEQTETHHSPDDNRLQNFKNFKKEIEENELQKKSKALAEKLLNLELHLQVVDLSKQVLDMKRSNLLLQIDNVKLQMDAIKYHNT